MKTSRELGFPHCGFKDLLRGESDLEIRLTKPTKNSDMFQAGKTLGVLSITCICHYY